MTKIDGPTEPRVLPGVAAATIHSVGDSMARWLPEGGAPAVVASWSESEWDVASWIAYWQSTAPWVLDRAVEDDIEIPVAARARLEHVRGLMRSRTALLLSEGAEVLEAATSGGVPVMPLKGLVISQRYFDDPLNRPMLDIDLLVGESDHDRVGEILLSLGYELEAKQRTASTWLRGSPSEEPWSPDHVRPIDLHVKAERDTARLGLDIDDLMWARSKRETILGIDGVPVPRSLDVLIHTGLRASRGIVAGDAKQAHLRDLEAISRALTEDDWIDLVETSDETTRRHLYPTVALLARYSRHSVPSGVVDALEASTTRRMRTWVRGTGFGSAGPTNYLAKSPALSPFRLFRLVGGPGEYLRFLVPSRQQVVAGHRWAGSPLWPLAYAQRRLRTLAAVLRRVVRSVR